MWTVNLYNNAKQKNKPHRSPISKHTLLVMSTIHPDYGPIIMSRIGPAYHITGLLDELAEEIRMLSHEDNTTDLHYFNRNQILEAWKEGRVYGLRVQETVDMAQRNAATDLVFLRNADGWPFHSDWMPCNDYILPCFCLLDENGELLILWCAERVRNYNLDNNFDALLSENKGSSLDI